MNNTFKANYWDSRYEKGHTGWDIGYPAPAIVDYFNAFNDKSVKILIPGAGLAHEGNYLISQGFKNVFLLDYSSKAINMAKNMYPDFPKNQIFNDDFFKHKGTYDIIVEHAFFSAIHPTQRHDYTKKCHELLSKGGLVAGLLFNRFFEKEGPPFGGNKEEYIELFSPFFNIKTMAIATNSIKPRQNNELFVIFEKI